MALAGAAPMAPGGGAAAAPTPAPAAAAAAANPLAGLSAANQKLFGQDVSTVESDIANNDFTGAWSTALQSSGLFDTKGYDAAMHSVTTDPLLGTLENNVSALDPSKQWTSAQDTAFYNAFNAQGAYHGQQITGQGGGIEALGKDPSGLWVKASSIPTAASNNSAAGGAPDVARYAGQRPTQSFLSKYGGAIATAVGDIGGSFIGDPMLGNEVVGAYDLTQGNYGGALSNLASSFVPGAGTALAGATGLSTGAATGLVGAGVGAAGAGLSGGNPLLGAIGGGVGGYLAGSNTAGNISNSVGGGTLGKVAGALGVGAIKAGTSLAAGTLLGNSGSPQQAAASRQAGISGGASLAGGLALGAAGGMATGSMGMNGSGSSLGNIGNMASGSTDSSLASTITGALPGILGAGATSAGALAGSNAQVNANQNAITTQQGNLGNIQNVWANQQATGQGANSALQSSLGLGGAAANPSNFLNMPGYQFAVQQGTQAIQRQAASLGSAYTPNTAQAVGQYVTGTAMSDYNTYISQLMGAAGLGSTANTGIATPTYQTGANISTLQQNQGYAQASGFSGASNAIGSLFGANGAGTSLLGAGVNYLNGSNSNTSGQPTTGTNPGDVYNPGSNYTYDANGNIIGQGAVNNSGVGGLGGGGGAVGSSSYGVP